MAAASQITLIILLSLLADSSIIHAHQLNCYQNGMHLTLGKQYLDNSLVDSSYWLNIASCGASDFPDAIVMHSGYRECGTIITQVTPTTIQFTNSVKVRGRAVPLFMVHCMLNKKSNPVSLSDPFLTVFDRRGTIGNDNKLSELSGTIDLDIRLAAFYNSNFLPGLYDTLDDLSLMDTRAFLEVSIRNGQNSPFIIQADQCWATPDADGGDMRRYEFLRSGCPMNEADEFTRDHPQTQQQDRFSLTSFYFEGSENLYFHCVVRVCVLGLDEYLCSKSCFERSNSALMDLEDGRSKVEPAAQRFVQFGPLNTKRAKRRV